ncbi:MAG: DUF2946 family protein [Betaproteobacteria bacterium]|nr:DUF2946 family protein [Betaproteobacteria bacterium]
MDEAVRTGVAKWPNVPDAYGWLALDARGEWRMRNPRTGSMERIGNAALRERIGRHYAADARGAWFYRNGPQRVFVRLERAPLVFRLGPGAIVDHCGQPAGALRGAWLDEQGGLLLAGGRGIGVLDDRDLGTACGHLMDRRGAPLDEAQLGALLAGEQDVAAFLAWGGARLALGRIASADLEARFGFVAVPRP